MGEQSPWLYLDREVTAEDTAGFQGYVYLITCLVNGKGYIGKKFLLKPKTRIVKGKKKKTTIASDWMSYWGSSYELLEDIKLLGIENFKREILHFCKTKTDAAYWELREQIDRRVMESDEYYNSFIFVRVRKKHLKSFLCT